MQVDLGHEEIDNVEEVQYIVENTSLVKEPRCEKTGLRGFRAGPTQTGLRDH